MSEKTRVRSPISVGGIVGGKYRVEKVIGAGGMGVVVAATHVELGRAVALKFIRPESLSGAASIERFMREARAAVRLKSEHVARVYDVGRDEEDRPYMVLELLEGEDLATLNRQRGPLSVADAVEYVLQSCEALVEAHAIGIVHRDLKPQNLFVTRRLNGAPFVKVLDFGIAKAVGPAAIGQMALTDSAAVIGSPLYMAPEQMRSARTADLRSDIWALGVILYELLGGRLPFDGETVTELCIRVVNEQPVPLSALRPGLDQKLVDAVMKCLAKAPEARFQNVAQLASALEPFARSAQQGGLVRPWRSFEDTHDVQSDEREAIGETVSQAAASEPSSPDAKSIRSIGSVAKRPTEEPAARKLAATGVAWGGSPTGERPRSFAKGLAAGVLASLVIAGGGAALFARPLASAESGALPPPSSSSLSATGAPPALVSTSVGAAIPLPAASSAPSAQPDAGAAASASASSASASAVSSGSVRVGRPAPRAGKPPETAVPTAASPPRAEPPAPNGAPILR